MVKGIYLARKPMGDTMKITDTLHPQSVLSEKPARLPIAGKIRTGKKVLIASAAADPKITAIFNKGVAIGKGYDAIEKDIIAAGGKANCLKPLNTPYFRVARRDFTMPEIADRILDLYAEERGEGRQLYRFPIILPFDNWLDTMPHGMRAYTKAGLKYWSEYDQAGARFCMQHRAPDIQNEKALRAWQGRGVMLRPENEGRCDPVRCAEYQRGECKLSGKLLFYIPNIPGASLIELGTTSFYSLSQMRATLELVYRVRHGRTAGTFNGKPIFYLTKREEQVTQIENGKPVKRTQYLVRLEADVQMDQVMAAQERQLTAKDIILGDDILGDAEDLEPLAMVPAAQAPEAVIAPPPPSVPAAAASGASSKDPALRALRESVYALMQALAEDKRTRFTTKMEDLYGTGWTRDKRALTEAKFELEVG